MTEFLSFTVIGLVLGSIYAITATGLVVTYTTTGVFNFAHGAVGMVAAFSFYELWEVWHWNPLLALAAVVLGEAPALAVVVEVVLMRRLHGGSATQSLMVTLGLLVILVGGATALWSVTVPRIVPPFFAGDSVNVFSVNVSYQQLITVAVAIVIAVGVRLFFKWFRIGVAMRAVVDDPELVAMSGAKPYRVSQMGWMLGFALAALAGALLAPTVSTSGLNIDTLTLLVVNGYAAAVVGRLRNLPVTFAAAIGLGLTTIYASDYLPGHIPDSIASSLPQIVPVAVLFLALLIVPGARLVAGRVATRRPGRVAGGPTSVAGGVVLVGAVVALSFALNGIAESTVAQGLALGIVALSLVLLTGYAGQISLCQLTFMGVGAYTMSRAFGHGSWLGVAAGVVVCAVLGALVALPAIRLRGLYLALATLAFGEVAYYAFFSNSSYFGGSGSSVSVGRPSLPFDSAVSDRAELIVIGVFFALCAVAVVAVRRSAYGRRLVAMNDSAAAFATLGMNATVTKVTVFAASSAMAGLGGCLYAAQNGAIGSSDVEFFSSLTLLLFVSIWGVRTTTGALLGGLTAASLPVAQSHLPTSLSDLTGLVAGVGIILLSRAPDGVLGLAGQLLFRPGVSRGGGPSSEVAGGRKSGKLGKVGNVGNVGKAGGGPANGEPIGVTG